MVTQTGTAQESEKPANVPELDTPDRDLKYEGIPTTEEEEAAKNIKNEWFPVQLQSEAFD